eukprot:1160568-Pelagomonas_calceolata.AAC.18
MLCMRGLLFKLCMCGLLFKLCMPGFSFTKCVCLASSSRRCGWANGQWRPECMTQDTYVYLFRLSSVCLARAFNALAVNRGCCFCGTCLLGGAAHA